MSALQQIQSFEDDMQEWRHDIHAHPQTAYEEDYVSDKVADLLAGWGIEFHRGLAKTGIVGVIEGKENTSGKVIGLRADLDALNIGECTDLPYASKHEGKMHACGHDGHTTMLLGAAKYLSETRNFNGKVHLIFQPAEEGERGADRMVEEGLFEQFHCDEVYGFHNWPELEAGKAGVCSGPALAAVDEFHIKVTGKGGHAAYPHLVTDPIVIAAHIITNLQSLVSRDTHPLDSAVVSVTMVSGGSAFNIIPETVELRGTARSLRPETRDMLETNIKTISESIAAAHGASIDYEYKHLNDATVNTLKEAQFSYDVLCDLLGEDNVIWDCQPTMGGEDFGTMLQHRPGSYIFMGQGGPEHKAKLHSPYYDFNDNILSLGASYFALLAEKSMPLAA